MVTSCPGAYVRDRTVSVPFAHLLEKADRSVAEHAVLAVWLWLAGRNSVTRTQCWASMSESITIVRKVKPVKLLSRINDGVTANVAFSDLLLLLAALGFKEVGGRGSQRVLARHDIPELLNLQEIRGQAKPYQVRQVAAVVRRYNLRLEDEL
jgi:hypothetical protein